MVETLLKLRTLVAYLGEKDQFNWWDTNFLSITGQRFLKVNFPRSAFSAGVHSVTEAAKQLHDSRIGRGRVFHLFRLPAETEEKLHNLLLNSDPATLPSYLGPKEQAFMELRKMSDSTLDAPEGPVQVGTGKNILSEFAIGEMAKHYYAAFNSGKQTFPYFTLD
ncbi:MAG: BrxE family protein [Syntrophobacteraceae bacterium]